MKNILITGATSGIGEAAAWYLSERGYHLVLTGRNEEKLRELKEKLDCLVYPFDLSDSNRISEIFVFCQKNQIKLDGLVHSAGIGGLCAVRSLELQDLEYVMKVNYFSFVQLLKYFVRKKYSNDGGSIVALSSLASYTADASMISYAGTKSAINSAIKVVSKECEKRRIRANAILPGMVKTPMATDADDYIKENQPYGYIEKEQVAYLIEFLLSDKAKYITGAEIPISGGIKF